MESQAKVILDTNMLLAVEQLKIDLMQEIENNLPKAKVLLPEQVMQELERLKRKSQKLEKAVKIAEKIIRFGKIKKIKVQAKNADKALLKLAKKGFIIATNDKLLRKKVKSIGGKCLIIRKRKYLTLE